MIWLKLSLQIALLILSASQVRLGEVRIVGNALIGEAEIRRALGLKRGEPFDRERLERGIGKLLEMYAEIGHPLARVRPSNFRLSPEGLLSFDLLIDEGEEVRIAEVKVSGLKKTKPEVILREIPIKPGDLYRRSVVEEARRVILNLPYVYDVDPAMIERGNKEGEVILNASVIEARTGRFEGAIGYSEGKLTGSLTFHEDNLFGTGRAVHLSWRSFESRETEFYYLEPWVLGRPVDLKLKGRVDSAGLKSYGLSIIGSIGTLYRFELGGAYEEISNPLPSRAALLDLKLVRDSRDYRVNPSRGGILEAGLELTRGDFDLTGLSLGVQLYLPILKRQVTALGVHFKTLLGDEVPAQKALELGGANTLRGYGEGWFSGRSIIYMNLEGRFLTGRGSHVFGFLDLGSVAPIDADPLSFEGLNLSYGVGVRLESPSGRVSLCYGLTPGTPLLSGRIHVSLGTAF